MNWSDWLIEPAIPLIGFIALIVVNIVVGAYALGSRRGRTNTRLNSIEERLDNPVILPQCNEIFFEIKTNLANLDGKVDTILRTMPGSSQGKD